jgi:glycosyltransferase involved in cell wall biosynthesis
MKPHVLFVGGEDHNLRIPFILAMRDRGFRVTAAGSGDPAPFAAAGIDFRPFHFYRFIGPLSDIRSLRSLAALLRELKPDVSQGYDTKPCLFLPLAARLAGHEGAIRTMCGRAWIYSPGSLLAWSMRPAYRAMHRIASWSTAATVFEIEDDREFFEQYGIGGRNALVIPAGGGGIDVAGFERGLAEQPSRAAMRTALGLGASEVVITVTRMIRQKGIASLLQAAAIVHRVRPGVKFVLVGPRESEGPMAITQAEIDAHAGYVIATGPRSDIPALLRMADVFAFPTEYREGVARALLEAGVAGLPIVATTMPGCTEVIRDGWNGYLVPPASPDRLAARILDALNNREASQTMAANASQLFRERFSLEAIADQHARLYAGILAGRSQARNSDVRTSQVVGEPASPLG